MTAKRKYYVLYDVLSDYSLERVDGKSEYGDLAHAKKRAVADNVDPRGKRSSAVKWRVDTKWREGPGGNKAWKGVNTAEELIYIIVERIKPQTLKKNPVKTFIATVWSVTAKKPAYMSATGWTLLKKNAKQYKTKALANYAGIAHADGAPTLAFASTTSTKEIVRSYGTIRTSNPISSGDSPRFTQKQLTTMRKEFATIKSVDPGKPTYNKMTAYLDTLSQPVLKQLAGARIKFLSALARNRVKPRKKNPKKPMWLIFNWNDYQLAFLHATNQWVSRRVAVRFTTKAQATKIAKSAAKHSRDIIGVAPSSMTTAQIITAVKDGCINTMRKRGKDKRRQNPVGPTQSQIDQAGELFKDFTGSAPDSLQKVRIRNPKTGLVIGELDGVLYTTVRDGKTERYEHNFKKGNRPHLVAAHDGQSLHILGGDYEFTERGIEG